MFKKTLFLLLSFFCMFCVIIGSIAYLITQDIEQEAVVLADGEVWFDDWFSITEIDNSTFAIGEPRYWQRNYNYLLLGNERALLFDSGPGVRNIVPVIESLTKLPVTVMSSHPHYDHIGNNHRFSQIAWLDVEPITREVEDNIFQPDFVRGFTIRTIPAFPITEWWQADQMIDIGGRELTLYFVPGHEAASVAVHDKERKFLFTGDFIYPGWLVAFAPTSDMNDYLASVQLLFKRTSGNETLYGAHSDPQHPSPALPFTALRDLERTLTSIIAGDKTPDSRFPLQIFSVNDDMELYLSPF